MCTSFLILYTCNCKKETHFVQCEERAGTNVKCARITKRLKTTATNYCKGYLVRPDAPKKYFSDPEAEDNRSQGQASDNILQ